jgi:hypothetical protein
MPEDFVQRNPRAQDQETSSRSRRGCPHLTVLQIISCPHISTAAVVELLISLPSLISLAFERLDRVFRSEALFETGQIFKVQNFEHHHSHLALEPGESPPTLAAEEGFFKQLAAAFPHLRTVKLSLTSESDNYMERLTTLTHLQEVIIDFPGHLGSGFHKFPEMRPKTQPAGSHPHTGERD